MPGMPSDVYAILDQKTHSKGLLIDVFDIFDEICERRLAERLVENRSILRHCRLRQQVHMRWSRGHRYFHNGPDFRGNRRSTCGEAVEFNGRKLVIEDVA
jgi:hypothetical protein